MSEETANNWVRDGHTLGMKFGPNEYFHISLVCPWGDKTFEGVKFEDLPPAFQVVKEDGSPDPDSGRYCNPCVWAEATGVDEYMAAEKFFDVESWPVHVEWSFDDDGPKLRPYVPESVAPDDMQDGKRYRVYFDGTAYRGHVKQIRPDLRLGVGLPALDELNLEHATRIEGIGEVK